MKPTETPAFNDAQEDIFATALDAAGDEYAASEPKPHPLLVLSMRLLSLSICMAESVKSIEQGTNTATLPEFRRAMQNTLGAVAAEITKHVPGASIHDALEIAGRTMRAAIKAKADALATVATVAAESKPESGAAGDEPKAG